MADDFTLFHHRGLKRTIGWSKLSCAHYQEEEEEKNGARLSLHLSHYLSLSGFIERAYMLNGVSGYAVHTHTHKHSHSHTQRVNISFLFLLVPYDSCDIVLYFDLNLMMMVVHYSRNGLRTNVTEKY